MIKRLAVMPHLAKPYHTCSVEVFNSLINMYEPKRQHFELNVMDSRVKLAVIDHNNNVGREQDVVRKERRERQTWGKEMEAPMCEGFKSLDIKTCQGTKKLQLCGQYFNRHK